MIKTRAITYYCGGNNQCPLELLVSIYSFRKFYAGNIVIVLGETSVPCLQPLIDSKEFITHILPNTKNDKKNQDHWVSRWRGMNTIKNDYDQVLHSDCDNMAVKDFDHLWGMIHPDSNYITSFYNVDIPPSQKEPAFQRILPQYRKIKPDFFCDNPIYTQLGLIGWNKGWPYFGLVSEYCKQVRDDQLAMSFVLMTTNSKLYQARNGDYTNMRGYHMLTPNERNRITIWHCGATIGYAMWWKVFIEARKNKFMNLHDNDYIKTINTAAYEHIINKDWNNYIFRPRNEWRKKGKVLEIVPRNLIDI